MNLLPWRLGARGFIRNGRTGVLLVVLMAVVLAAPLAASTISSTAAFSAPEVAAISMGQAVVQVRTTQYEQGRTSEDGPQTGQAGITRVVEDADLDLVLEGPTGQVAVQGRWLPYRDSVAAGILVQRSRIGRHAQLALSQATMTELGVGLGDRVSVPKLGIDLVVTDLVAFAPDTGRPLAIIDPSAVSAVDRDAFFDDAGSIRWLLETDDLPATLRYLDELDLVATTRAAVPADETEPLVDPAVAVTVFSVLAIVVLVGGGTALAGFHRRQSLALARLGAARGRARRPIVIESTLIALAGIALALPLALGVALVGRWWGERQAEQLWGPLVVSWPLYAGTAAVALVLGPALAVASSSPPRHHDVRTVRQGESHRRRRITAWLLGRRLARQRRRGAAAGVLSVGAVIAVGSAAVLIMNFAARGYTEIYSSEVPEDMVWVGLPRQLTGDESRALAAATGTAITEDRRAVYFSTAVNNVVPVVVDSPMTQCRSDPANNPQFCDETVTTSLETTVAVIDPSQAKNYFGRELSVEETAAITAGDGLLLSPEEGATRLVPYGSVQADAAAQGATGLEYDRVIAPVPILGYAGYESVPGLLIGPAAMERWGLQLDPEPISYYLLTAIDARPSEQVVRSALPPQLAVDADINYDKSDEGRLSFAATERAITGTTSALVFLIVTLLVLTWAADAEMTMNRLRRLGASRSALTWLLLSRGSRAILPALIIGTALTPALTWAFSQYAHVAITINGWAWLAPTAAAAAALPIVSILRSRSST